MKNKSKDWKCRVCNLSNYSNRDNCVNCGSPNKIICTDCGSEYIYSKFLESFMCPNCTAPKIGPVLFKTMTKCSTCGGPKAPLVATCDSCKDLAQLLINQYGDIGSDKLFSLMKEKNNYDQ